MNFFEYVMFMVIMLVQGFFVVVWMFVKQVVEEFKEEIRVVEFCDSDDVFFMFDMFIFFKFGMWKFWFVDDEVIILVFEEFEFELVFEFVFVFKFVFQSQWYRCVGDECFVFFKDCLSKKGCRKIFFIFFLFCIFNKKVVIVYVEFFFLELLEYVL